MFWVTTIIRMVASLFDVIIVERWNKDAGISDEVRRQSPEPISEAGGGSGGGGVGVCGVDGLAAGRGSKARWRRGVLSCAAHGRRATRTRGASSRFSLAPLPALPPTPNNPPPSQHFRAPATHNQVMYMLGDNIIYQVTYMMSFMPAVVLTSKVCPENMEVSERIMQHILSLPAEPIAAVLTRCCVAD